MKGNGFYLIINKNKIVKLPLLLFSSIRSSELFVQLEHINFTSNWEKRNWDDYKRSTKHSRYSMTICQPQIRRIRIQTEKRNLNYEFKPLCCTYDERLYLHHVSVVNRNNEKCRRNKDPNEISYLIPELNCYRL